MSLIDDFIESTEPGGSSTLANYNGHAGAGGLYSNDYSNDDMVRMETGFVSTGLNETDNRIFILDRVQLAVSAPIVVVTVSNDTLVLILETFQILRIDLQKEDQIEYIDIPRKPTDGLVTDAFFDPTGRHLIITTDRGENYYLYQKWQKCKPLKHLKGHVITSIAWNKQATLADPSTREILIGTKNGQIHEACLEPSDDLFRREEKPLRFLYAINEPTSPISGLHFEQFPGNSRKYFIIAATPTRIYEFVGTVGSGQKAAVDTEDKRKRATFESIFTPYESNPVFQELPGDLSYSELHFYSQFKDLQQRGVAQSFAWLTVPGIYHGSLVFGSQNPGEHVIDNAQLLQYPTNPAESDEPQLDFVPLSIAMTEFHFILMYKDRLRAICHLNDEIVYEEMINLATDEHVIGLTMDEALGTSWVYTNLSLYQLVIEQESRDVWKIYLEKKQYDTALHYCRDDAQRDKVYTTQANDYFAQQRYQLSAKYFAESAVPFEEVALQFIERDERDALRNYVSNKLDRLKKGDLTQKTMLATWLVELYLSKINQLEDFTSSAMSTTDLISTQASTVPDYKQQQEDIEDEFKTFLETYKGHLHKPTTYKLIASHGRSSAMLYYADLIGDYDRVISHWIIEQDWAKALEVLGKQANPDVFYKYSPALMENSPNEMVTLWMQSNLNPRQLIPSLLRYDHSKVAEKGMQNQAIRYLSYVVTTLGNTDPAIHNYLLTLYATQPTKDETALLVFLKNEGREMHYNLDYALRLCSQNNRMQSCVHIYSQMGLFEEAVNLSLKYHDLELARINADKPEDDDVLRKRLWLNIAKHVVQEKNDIKTAMEFLKQSDLLKIEDILPFFPDFVLIDDFKDEICSALEEYNIHIEDLKTDMDEATRSAENIRLDIRQLRSRFVVIGSMERCCLCDMPLLTRQFYVFPCQHSFHADCLVDRITKYLNTRQIRRLLDLQEQLSKELSSKHSQQQSSGFNSTANKFIHAAGNLKGVIFPGDTTMHGNDDAAIRVARSEQLKEELDDIVAGECVLCGDIMIKTIDQPFIGEDEVDVVMSWSV
ncbi:tethering complex subunit [Umbelopsis sp. WA50703]